MAFTVLFKFFSANCVLIFTGWPYYLCKLLIPSVLGYHDQPERYLYPRFTAMYATIINFETVKSEGGSEIDWRSEKLSLCWGKINKMNAKDYEYLLNQKLSENSLAE